MKRFIIISFILIYYLNSSIYPQDKPFRFEHITVDNGLSENAITSIVQDKQGFLWFGSHDGLNRYDGYSLRIFRNDPKNHLTISSNLIQYIFEDSDGKLWICTFNNGLDRYDPDTNIFIHYVSDSRIKNSISDNNILTIYEDRNKTLWIGTAKGGLNKFNRKTQTFHQYINDPKNSKSISSNFIKKIFEDSLGTLWIGTQKGLNSFNREKLTFKLFNFDKDGIGLSLISIRDITEDKSGYLWIATDKALIQLDTKNKSFIRFQNDAVNRATIFDDNSSKIFIDNEDLIWISSWGKGIDVFNPKKGGFKHHNHEPGKSYSLSHNRISQIFSDRSDIIWLATEGGGINKFDKRKMVFENYHHDPLNKNSLSQNNIKRIYEDSNGILWIGTDGKGLNKFDRKKNKFKVFINNPNNPQSISSNYIKSIFEDRFGYLWIGTMEGGLNKYDNKTDSFVNFRYNKKDINSIPSDTVSDIIEDSDGVLWFTFEFGESGLARYDRNRNIFIRYNHKPDNPKSISNTDIVDIFEDKDKTIWCGGSYGLNRFNREDETFTNYRFDQNNKSGLSHSWVWSIFEDKTGRLWVGTYGAGLNLFDKKNNSFIHYTVKEGLANNVVYGILDDEEGNLWISTNKGISKFNPQNESFKNYDKRDGLQGNEFNTGSYFKGKDGRLYFGGTNGLTAFYPKDVKNNLNIPSIVITSFKVFNKEFNLPGQISKIKRINLKYDQNFISFEFASLDYSIPGKNRYAYKLEGIDKDWIYRDAKKRFADYTDLSPGTYLFTVKGSNNDGIWNEQGVSIKIQISPPFWKTKAFTILWISLIILIILLVINFTYRYIILLKEKAQADRFAAIGKYASFLAHDIKSPLEGTYLIINELKKMLPANDEKHEYIDDAIGGIIHIRSIIKGSLDFAKVNNPKFEKFDLTKIIEEFCNEFSKNKECIFKFDLNKEIVLVDHSLIQRVFLNLFNNSYQAKKEICEINIKTERSKKNILISVSDTGRGISKELQKNIFEPFSSNKEDGHGIGLAFVSEVIKNHRGSIKVESESDMGATFIISLPLLKNKENI